MFPVGAVFGTSRDADRRALEQQAASSYYAALCSATNEAADPLSVSYVLPQALKPYYRPTYNVVMRFGTHDPVSYI